VRVALYARTSTTDKDQNPETQLLALRDFCQAQSWSISREYVDQAAANDVRGRRQWRELLDDAGKKRFQVILVFKLDRAFRSVKHMHDTLAAWAIAGVSFQSVRERFDTSTALGRLMLNLLASLAEFELELISERVRAGMDRARRQGKKLGRPRVDVSLALKNAPTGILERFYSREISLRQLSEATGVPKATLHRYLQNHCPKMGDQKQEDGQL